MNYKNGAAKCCLCMVSLNLKSVSLNVSNPLPLSFLDPVSLLQCFDVQVSHIKATSDSEIDVCCKCYFLITGCDMLYPHLHSLVSKLTEVWPEKLKGIKTFSLNVSFPENDTSNTQFICQRKIPTVVSEREGEIRGHVINNDVFIPDVVVSFSYIEDKANVFDILTKLASEHANKRVDLSKSLPCMFCDMVFSREEEWNTHSAIMHKMTKTWQSYALQGSLKGCLFKEVQWKDKLTAECRSKLGMGPCKRRCYACAEDFEDRDVFILHLQDFHHIPLRWLFSGTGCSSGDPNRFQVNGEISEKLDRTASHASTSSDTFAKISTVSQESNLQREKEQVTKESILFKGADSPEDEQLRQESSPCEGADLPTKGQHRKRNRTCIAATPLEKKQQPSKESSACSLADIPKKRQLSKEENSTCQTAAPPAKRHISKVSSAWSIADPPEKKTQLSIKSSSCQRVYPPAKNCQLPKTSTSYQRTHPPPKLCKLVTPNSICQSIEPPQKKPRPSTSIDRKNNDSKETPSNVKIGHTKHWRCKFCGELFSDWSIFDKHKQTAHIRKTRSKKMECESGNFGINELNSIKLEKDVVSCALCTVVFHNEEALKVHHELIHKQKVLVVESHCQVLQHCHIKENLKPTQEHVSKTDAVEYLEDKKSFSCDICSLLFSTKTLLAYHNKVRHENNSILECKTCHRRLIGHAAFQRHMSRVHHKYNTRKRLYACKMCINKTFSRAQHYKHMKKNHDIDRMPSATCETCGKSVNASYLQKHIAIVHEKARNYPCNFCDMKFPSRKCVTRHVHFEHTNEKWKCDECSLEFAKYQQVYLHKKYVHSTNVHDCTQCTKSYKIRAALISHIKRCHENRVPLTCSICSKTLIDSQQLRKHLMKVHGMPWESTLSKDFARRLRENNCLVRRGPRQARIQPIQDNEGKNDNISALQDSNETSNENLLLKGNSKCNSFSMENSKRNSLSNTNSVENSKRKSNSGKARMPSTDKEMLMVSDGPEYSVVEVTEDSKGNISYILLGEADV